MAVPNRIARTRKRKGMTWDEQWRDEDTIRKWLKPNRKVVALSKELKTLGFRRALDLGCGVGRHVISLAKDGWEVHASDFSGPAVKYCREWLTAEGLSAIVRKMSMAEIPYPDCFFDLIISYNAVYHTTLRGMLDEIHLIYRK